MVKNLPSNAGDAGSIAGRGTKIPHAATKDPPRMLQLRTDAVKKKKKKRIRWNSFAFGKISKV